MTDTLIVNEVGPRDGLQNQPRILTPAQRLELVRSLLRSGLEHIQVGAFVSPSAVPAMAGTDEVLAGLAGERGRFSVLVPNEKGFELALAAGAQTMEMVLYGTDAMAQANARMSMAGAEEITGRILQRAREHDVEIVATISVAFECPFEGAVDSAVIHSLALRLLERGAHKVVIADTIGAADPARVKSMMSALAGESPPRRLGCHFHDTRGMGLANVYAAMEAGIRLFDASVAGIGGCPFAPGASGNVATEDVVMMAEQMGFDTGVDMPKLLDAAHKARELTGRNSGGRATAWLERHWARSA